MLISWKSLFGKTILGSKVFQYFISSFKIYMINLYKFLYWLVTSIEMSYHVSTFFYYIIYFEHTEIHTEDSSSYEQIYNYESNH